MVRLLPVFVVLGMIGAAGAASFARADTESALTLSAEERAWIAANPTIRVHNELDWPPFNFAVDNVPLGYSIDFMNLLAERAGLDVDYVTGPSWNQFLEMMKAGSLDVMLNIVKTPDRQTYLLYTPPIADNPNTILSRKDDGYQSLEELAGKTVAVPKGFFYEEVLGREFPSIRLHLVGNTLDTMKAVVFGQADAAVGELAVFNHLLEEHLIPGLVVSGEVRMGDPELSLLNIATRRDLPVLASILTKAVQSVGIEELRAIRNKWLPPPYKPGVDVVLVLQVGGGVAFVLVVVVLWNRQLQREVRRRRQVEEALLESEARLKDVAEVTSDWFWETDENDRFTFISDRFFDVMKVRREDVIGKSRRDFSGADVQGTDPELWRRHFDDLDNRRPFRGLEYAITGVDGVVRYIRVSGVPVFDEAGAFKGYRGADADVTQRKRAEALLRESERRLMDAIDSLSAGFALFDGDKCVVLCNAQYRDIYGYAETDVPPGTSLDDLTRIDSERGLVLADAGGVETLRRRAASYGESQETFLVPLTDGRWIQIRDRPTSAGGIVSIHTDVSERVRAENTIKEARDRAANAEALLKDAIDNIADGFVLYDADDRLVMCNAHFKDLYGYGDADVEGGPSWTDLEAFDTERGIIEWESDGDVPRGQRRWDDFERKLSDGRWVFVRQRRTQSGGLACIHVDITTQKEAERIMKVARDEAERIADAKSEFVAVVSHEIRTPMNGVLGMARHLEATTLDDDQRACTETIVASGEALIDIIDDLLDVSKLEAGRIELEEIPFAPRDVVAKAMAVMAPRADEKGLRFSAAVDPDVPDVLVGDPHRIRQVLLNLISNAIKFTEAGSVDIAVALEATAPDAATVRFAVTDTGVGVSPEAQKRLFTDYTQASVDVARKYGGTGLGLSICRRLISLMDGDIALVSTPGRGSTFSFRASFAVGGADDLAAAQRAHPTPAAAERPLVVLQVEDNPTNSAVVERALARAGHRIVNTTNGREALDALGAEPFDAVVMDRHMPVMDGCQATAAIRALDGPVGTIPILGVTAGASAPEVRDCLAAGMDVVLPKPVDTDKLVSELHRLTARPVLLVDDDALNHTVLGRHLDRLGVAHRSAYSGPEALSMMQAKTFRTVFADLSMPEMDGLAFVRAVRAAESGDRTPIFVVTGHVGTDVRATAQAAGADAVLAKPLAFEALAECLGMAPSGAVRTEDDGGTPEVQPIDLLGLSEILGTRDEGVLLSMLECFTEAFPELLPPMTEAIDARDGRALRDAAHKAKSAALNASAPPLVDVLKRIEAEAPDCAWDTLSEQVEEAHAAYGAVEAFLADRRAGGHAP